MNEPKLNIQAGFSSLQGRREDNQDFVSFTQPDSLDLGLHGIVAIVADGMGGMKGGRVAAEIAVRMFIEGFYSTSETLGVELAAAKSLDSANRWIHAVGQRDPELAGMATTFSALILRHRQAHLIHVGDSRIYRLRLGVLEKLTEDHTLKHPDMDHILYRAVGIENTLCAECVALPLEAHDRFLLCSDGLHAVLLENDLRKVLLERMSPEASAQTLSEMAFAKGSQDNITALVVDVISLPPPNRDVLQNFMGSLPLLELPKAGQSVDGYWLEKTISIGRYGSLFLAHDQLNQKQLVLKFPHPKLATEREYYHAFVREAWIGARVHSPWVAEVIETPPGRQSRLYTVMPYYAGKTLEQFIAHSSSVSLSVGIAIALPLCKAIHALHRLRIIHRDIKPDNILLLETSGLKLLDLGVARLPAWDEDINAPIPGTASYMAPEQFKGERGTVATDLFATGVTLFRLFAQGVYPYGEIEPFSTPRYHGRAKSLNHYRPDLPSWLDAVLARALAVDPKERYADIMELAYELENGLAKGGQIKPQKRSWYERNPLLFWKLFSLSLFGLLMVCAGKLVLLCK
ncbi:MAG: protein phosphatase [Candidatus Methylumidiphilus alinenensis]|uniref:Protein phosphatase n=1 Tax=Candidatus Methylumidiphilus alinenensis TaxID=2202197 RepID=A0A2W4SJU6_9GAMM|nr:MAG: protein phosphatase [Candidatus Methylumidiphilus alinenensis]